MYTNHENKFSNSSYVITIKSYDPSYIYKTNILIYSVLVSVSCPKALFHLESDNLFCITVVVADWLD